jgi:hypothetical protein
MTLHLLKVDLQTFLSIPITQKKMPNFELWHSCRKWAISSLPDQSLYRNGFMWLRTGSSDFLCTPKMNHRVTNLNPCKRLPASCVLPSFSVPK